LRLENKTALVTGASVGIGRAIARKLASEGARVGLVARSTDRLETLKVEIEAAGGTAAVFPADLTKVDSIATMWSAVEKAWDTVDILVNAAGVWHEGGKLLLGPPLQEMPVEQIERVLAVQLVAPMLLARHAIPRMIARHAGKILNISGELRSAAGWVDYYVSKKGLESFTVGLAEELHPHEIQVNCLSPADTLSETYAEYFPGYDPRDVLTPEDVADFALLLVSDETDHITGSITVMRSKTARPMDPSQERLIESSREKDPDSNAT
jgi:3-oxoacyl-[acyl-carrier protein] reductase